MSDEATDKAGKTWLYVSGILAMLPVLYVLSAGPAVMIQDKFPSVGSRIGNLYAPVEHLYFNGPHWMHEALDAYLGFWRAKS